MKIYRFVFLTLLLLTASLLAACGQQANSKEAALASQAAPKLRVILLPNPPGTPNEGTSPATLTMGPGEVQDVPIETLVENCNQTPIDPGDPDVGICDGSPQLSVLQAPSGINATIIGGSLHIELGNNPQSGQIVVNATITSQNGNQVQTLSGGAALQLTVAPFSLSLTPANLSVLTGSSGVVTVNIARFSTFTGAVDLSLEGNTTGLTPTFSSDSASGNSSTLTIAVSNTAVAGLRTLTVKGVSGNITRTATLNLTVQSFTLAVSPTTLEAVPGRTANGTVNITRLGGFSGRIQLALEGAPPGVTAVFNPKLNLGSSSLMSLSIASNVPVGTYRLIVRGTSGTLTRTATFNLQVKPFLVTVSPTSVNLPRGNSRSVTVTITRGTGFTGSVVLDIPTAVQGIIPSFSPQIVTGTTSTLQLLAANNTSLGSKSLTVSGTSASANDTANLNINVVP